MGLLKNLGIPVYHQNDLFGFNLWVWEHLEQPWNPGTCCSVAKPGEWWLDLGVLYSQANPCGSQWRAKPMRNTWTHWKIQGFCQSCQFVSPRFCQVPKVTMPCLSTWFRCILPDDLNLTIVQQIPQGRLENPWRSWKNRWTSMKQTGHLWESMRIVTELGLTSGVQKNNYRKNDWWDHPPTRLKLRNFVVRWVAEFLRVKTAQYPGETEHSHGGWNPKIVCQIFIHPAPSRSIARKSLWGWDAWDNVALKDHFASQITLFHLAEPSNKKNRWSSPSPDHIDVLRLPLSQVYAFPDPSNSHKLTKIPCVFGRNRLILCRRFAWKFQVVKEYF